jgi:hypothetical protein
MTFVGEARKKTRSGRDMPQMETVSPLITILRFGITSFVSSTSDSSRGNL